MLCGSGRLQASKLGCVRPATTPHDGYEQQEEGADLACKLYATSCLSHGVIGGHKTESPPLYSHVLEYLTSCGFVQS